VKANNISISIPAGKENGKKIFCNKNCEYCVSKMTGFSYENEYNFYENLKKAKKIADVASVNSVIITGKSEPTLNLYTVEIVCKLFKDFPIEIQTNGVSLLDNPTGLLTKFKIEGINTIAVSMDNVKQFEEMAPVFAMASEMNFTVRITVNLTNKLLLSDNDIDYYFNYCRDNGIHQLSFRKITIPNKRVYTLESDKACEWIRGNVDDDLADAFVYSFEKTVKKEGVPIYTLPFGATVYMVRDISCTIFEHCIQEVNNFDDIRSLVYHEDGHMSMSWYGSNYGRIF
jgi:organic radical activating enzyme